MKSVEELREEIAGITTCKYCTYNNYLNPHCSWTTDKHLCNKATEDADDILSIFLDQTKGDCPECGGNGWVMKKEVIGQTESLTNITCHTCNGTGKGEWNFKGLVVLDKDQHLPALPRAYTNENMDTDWLNPVGIAYLESQQAMLKANFRRVRLLNEQ